MTEPLGPVVITPRDIYDALIRLQDTVGQLVSQNVGHGDDIRDHETRLRAVEAVQPASAIPELRTEVEKLKAGRWPLPALAALTGVGALVVAVIALFYRGPV